jgi:hypothetical protein
MKRVFAASVFIAAGVTTFAMAGDAAWRRCSVFYGCAGMELAQSAGPNDNSQDGNSGAAPDDGSANGNSQAPGNEDQGGTDQGDGGGDEGTNPDQGSPPDAAQPPGCIFRNEPLDLLV